MAEIARLTITLPAAMAAAVKRAVSGGDYASSSEVIREALRDWAVKRALQRQEFASPKGGKHYPPASAPPDRACRPWRVRGTG